MNCLSLGAVLGVLLLGNVQFNYYSAIVTIAAAAAAPNLQLRSMPMSQGEYCQGSVTFTCRAGDIISGNLFWYIRETGNSDSKKIASYSYRPTHMHPHTLHIQQPLSGVSSIIHSANSSRTTPGAYDLVSLLKANDILVLNGTTLYCEGTFGTPSNNLDIEVTTLSKLFIQLTKYSYENSTDYSL